MAGPSKSSTSKDVAPVSRTSGEGQLDDKANARAIAEGAEVDEKLEGEPDATGLDTSGEVVVVDEGLVGSMADAEFPAGNLSWRAAIGDIVYAKVDQDENGRRSVVAAIVTRVQGQLPGGHKGWLVNVTTFGANGGTSSIEGMALFGGPDDERRSEIDGPSGWVRRNG